MKVAVIQFPGSNCDQDALHSLQSDLGIEAEYLWHTSGSLRGFSGVIVPGGFSYGDYLRCGAMAARSNVMAEVIRLANTGYPVIGICNGFQVLCEAGILEGALLRNENEKFLCKNVYLSAVNRTSCWTTGVSQVLCLPIAHGEGRFTCTDETLKSLQDKDQIAFHYVSPEGKLDPKWNLNGSMHSIAGILNQGKNVLGMMPHPERATNSNLNGVDGKQILSAFQLVIH